MLRLLRGPHLAASAGLLSILLAELLLVLRLLRGPLEQGCSQYCWSCNCYSADVFAAAVAASTASLAAAASARAAIAACLASGAAFPCWDCCCCCGTTAAVTATERGRVLASERPFLPHMPPSCFIAVLALARLARHLLPCNRKRGGCVQEKLRRTSPPRALKTSLAQAPVAMHSWYCARRRGS